MRPDGGGMAQYSTVVKASRPPRRPLAPLAMRAEIRAALPLAQHAYGRSALLASLAFTPIDVGLELEMPGTAIGTGEVPQRAAAAFHGPRQHLADRTVQAPRTLQPYGTGTHRRPDAGQEQHLARVDVAHADDHPACQQQLLDGHAAGTQPRMEGLELEILPQGFGAQPPQQLVRLGVVLPGRPDHGAKTAWVVQPQGAMVGHHVEVVVRAALGQSAGKTQ